MVVAKNNIRFAIRNQESGRLAGMGVLLVIPAEAAIQNRHPRMRTTTSALVIWFKREKSGTWKTYPLTKRAIGV
jgi:hypothetical protein